jgi:hypothetical protein
MMWQADRRWCLSHLHLLLFYPGCKVVSNIAHVYYGLLLFMAVAVIEGVSESSRTRSTNHSSSDLWKLYVYLLMYINTKMYYSA